MSDLFLMLALVGGCLDLVIPLRIAEQCFLPHHASWLAARALRPFINHSVTLRAFVWKRLDKHLIFIAGRLKTQIMNSGVQPRAL